jgi:hypothetical protein
MLSAAERWSLAIPLAGGAVFGALTFLIPTAFGQAVGYSGNDPYVGRLAGAAALGYPVALLMGMREGAWPSLRAVVVATLTFNVVSLIACAIEIVAGRAQPIVYLIAGASLLITAVTWTLLRRHGARPQGPRDVATYVVALAVLGTIASATFGITPQFPSITAPLGGYHGTDEFVYRQAGAATAGYAVMGIWELRSLRWAELRLPTAMALVFNGLAFVASLLELGAVTLGVALVAPASLLFTVGTLVALVRRGR